MIGIKNQCLFKITGSFQQMIPGLRHILMRHAFDTMAVNVSKFLRGMGAAEIRALILEAASSRTAAWRIAPNGFLVTEVNLGRAIGTDVDGNVATALKIVAQGDGSVVTAFPLKWPP